MKKLSKQNDGTMETPTIDSLAALSAAGRHQSEEVMELAPKGRGPGRPRREVPTVQRTVSFTDDALSRLKKLSARSDREGYERPDFSKTVRVALRLAETASEAEVKKAFNAELDGEGRP
ncbi:MAG TPA: hypothetical protein VGD78_04250 [Chthoniobacterales bacterium]